MPDTLSLRYSASGLHWHPDVDLLIRSVSDSDDPSDLLQLFRSRLQTAEQRSGKRTLAGLHHVSWSAPERNIEFPEVKDSSAWLEFITEQAMNPAAEAFVDLVTLELLFRRGKKIGTELFDALWERLLDWNLSESVDANESLTDHAKQTERLWKTSLLLGSLASTDHIRVSAERSLDEMLELISVADGAPLAVAAESLCDVLATLVRTRQWMCDADVFETDDVLANRFRTLVIRLAVHLDREGQFTFASEAGSASSEILALAAQQIGLKKSNRFRKLIDQTIEMRQPRGKIFKLPKSGQFKEDSEISWQEDSARMACLRTNALPGADVLSVLHSDHTLDVHLTGFGLPILNGPWTSTVEIDGTMHDMGSAEWTCTCWHSDRDGDYLELKQEHGPLRIERSLYLTRDDRMAFLADAVISTGPGQLRYRTRFPVASGLSVRHDPKSGLDLLSDEHRLARVFPLFLPQAAPERSTDVCSYEQTSQQTLHAVTVFDWNPERQQKPVTWKLLTVSETNKKSDPAAAAGYRLKIGNEQWLLYRSLQQTPYARSVLGHQTRHETVIGRFDDFGDVHPLLIVE